jgi:4-hydroxy-4-methyl-2-oxoglutarate aldolase
MDQELRARFDAVARLGTGPISDAMEGLRLPRAVITGWCYVTADPFTALVGPAFTMRQTAKGRARAHEDNDTRQGEVAAGLAAPGDIIVIDAGGRTEIATWGETYSTQARARGVAGLLINGALRDSARVRRSGFPVLCRAVSPVASRWDLATAAIGEAVTIGGVLINPGDIVYGDDDGVLIIPRAEAPAVFDRALTIVRSEEQIRATL